MSLSDNADDATKGPQWKGRRRADGGCVEICRRVVGDRIGMPFVRFVVVVPGVHLFSLSEQRIVCLRGVESAVVFELPIVVH